MFKIACVGDSITNGYLVDNREVNCYPAVLNELLGDDYVVGNFGVNGATLLKSGDFPYWEQENFKLSGMLDPDYVIIMLGTNDSKDHNFKTMDEFIADYELLIDYYRKLPNKPRIYIATPATMHENVSNDTHGIRGEVIDEIADALRALGKKLRISVVDVNKKTKDFSQGFDPDGVHTNVKGAKLIAETVYNELRKK